MVTLHDKLAQLRSLLQDIEDEGGDALSVAHDVIGGHIDKGTTAGKVIAQEWAQHKESRMYCAWLHDGRVIPVRITGMHSGPYGLPWQCKATEDGRFCDYEEHQVGETVHIAYCETERARLMWVSCLEQGRHETVMGPGDVTHRRPLRWTLESTYGRDPEIERNTATFDLIHADGRREATVNLDHIEVNTTMQIDAEARLTSSVESFGAEMRSWMQRAQELRQAVQVAPPSIGIKPPPTSDHEFTSYDPNSHVYWIHDILSDSRRSVPWDWWRDHER